MDTNNTQYKGQSQTWPPSAQCGLSMWVCGGPYDPRVAALAVSGMIYLFKKRAICNDMVKCSHIFLFSDEYTDACYVIFCVFERFPSFRRKQNNEELQSNISKCS